MYSSKLEAPSYTGLQLFLRHQKDVENRIAKRRRTLTLQYKKWSFNFESLMSCACTCISNSYILHMANIFSSVFFFCAAGTAT